MPRHPDYFVDTNPCFNPDFQRTDSVPVRYGRVLEIGETAFGNYRTWTDLSVDTESAANWMA